MLLFQKEDGHFFNERFLWIDVALQKKGDEALDLENILEILT
jgi:hypothetical protein